MSGEYDPHFQLLQIETCTSKLIVKTMIKQDENIELTSETFAGHVDLSFANSQDTIVQIAVSDSVPNP
jgi:hypothetical protein